MTKLKTKFLNYILYILEENMTNDYVSSFVRSHN